MKSAIIGTLLGVVVAAIAVTSSCSINHRSDSYACTQNADCDGGRVCSDGFCVTAASAVDAPRGDGPRGDATGCPGQCTSCNTTQRTCTINCQLTNCQNLVTCPSGYRCDIACNVDNACRNGVNCGSAAACNIDCTAKESCQGVVCGPGPCDVGCSGPSSCRNVSCGPSCACDVLCTGNQSCQQNISCSSLACRSGSGCTSVPALCHSCN
jgi:hypothetical protein